ncbi:Hypothetical_protein [Hexamita inflata]|uniref:Hypothetical_protein n=1 Tax=Hexamita inflata TaxID=28002 RepID=A0AA86PWT4_9EUKA|nr:Hypothetical protein HINF_LOCUS30370 [Hexamita inflata]
MQVDITSLSNLRFRLLQALPQLDPELLQTLLDQFEFATFGTFENFSIYLNMALPLIIKKQMMVKNQLNANYTQIRKKTIETQDSFIDQNRKIDNLNNRLKLYMDKMNFMANSNEIELTMSFIDDIRKQIQQKQLELQNLIENNIKCDLILAETKNKSAQNIFDTNQLKIQLEQSQKQTTMEFNKNIQSLTTALSYITDSMNQSNQQKQQIITSKIALKSSLSKEKERTLLFQKRTYQDLKELMQKNEQKQEQMRINYLIEQRKQQNSKFQEEEDKKAAENEIEFILSKYQKQLREVNNSVEERQKEYKIRKMSFQEAENRLNYEKMQKDERENTINAEYKQIIILQNTIKHQEEQLRYLQSLSKGESSKPFKINVVEAYE